jgi:hypothetical protein
MNADGTNQTRLTNTTDFFDNNEPTWSPDGSKIAFVRDSQIYVMNADGTNQTPLTSNSSGNSNPAWSPDASKLTFVSFRDGNGQIYTMNVDGSNQTRLTNNSLDDNEPAWSPDGSKIVFNRNSNIYVMNADGSNQEQLTDSANDSNPSWSPDGTQIAFATFRDPQGDNEIYLMNADGSSQTNITNFPTAQDFEPAWQRQSAIPNVTIGGRVTDTGGNGLSGVTINLTSTNGGTTGTATTDANGNYSFVNLASGGNYTVTPSLINFTFAPPSQTFENLQTNQTANFAGTLNTFTLSGQVTENGNALAMSPSP